MLGILFFSSLIFLFVSILLQWLVSSRMKGNDWAFNWFPPIALMTAYGQRNTQKCLSIIVFISLVLSLLIGGAWFATNSSIQNSAKSTQSIVWIAELTETSLSIQPKHSFVANEEWLIYFDTPVVKTTLDGLQLASPVIVHSDQNKATKLFESKRVDITSVRFEKRGANYLVIMTGDADTRTFDVEFPSVNAASFVVTKRDVDDQVKRIWKHAPKFLSYQVGAARSISDRQKIVGFQIYDNQTLIKELTLTFDQKASGVIINHRSLLVLREFLSNVSTRKRNSQLFETLTLDAFLPQTDQYLTKPVTLIKLDGSSLDGFYAGIEKKKVLHMTQSLGAGTVEVINPLELIKEFRFKNLSVIVNEQTETAISESRQTEPSTMNVVSQPLSEEGSGSESDVISQEDQESISFDAELTESGDSQGYRELIGQALIVYKNDGQSRVGRLVKVTSNKSITLQLLNGGLEVQIPQSDIKNVEISN